MPRPRASKHSARERGRLRPNQHLPGTGPGPVRRAQSLCGTVWSVCSGFGVLRNDVIRCQTGPSAAGDTVGGIRTAWTGGRDGMVAGRGFCGTSTGVLARGGSGDGIHGPRQFDDITSGRPLPVGLQQNRARPCCLGQRSAPAPGPGRGPRGTTGRYAAATSGQQRVVGGRRRLLHPVHRKNRAVPPDAAHRHAPPVPPGGPPRPPEKRRISSEQGQTTTRRQRSAAGRGRYPYARSGSTLVRPPPCRRAAPASVTTFGAGRPQAGLRS